MDWRESSTFHMEAGTHMTSKKRPDLVILGGGSFGTALAKMAGGNGARVLMWVRRNEQAREITEEHRNSRYLPGMVLPDLVEATSDLEHAVSSAHLILMAIPSKSFRNVASRMGDMVSPDQILVHVTKGLERGTHKRMTEILTEETCLLKIGALSGPNLAKELIAGHPSGTLVASRFDEVAQAVQAIYAGSMLRVYRGDDVVGTEIAGAFKNVVALACGAAHGMGFGQNTVSLLITRGLSEMATLGTAMGAQVWTFGGLAGIGDLVATCTSPLSRNHTVGERLGKGEALDDILASMTQVAEGVPTAQAIFEFAQERSLDLPIARTVRNLVQGGWSAKQAFEHLMDIPVGRELAKLRYR